MIFIKTLNNISEIGLRVLPKDKYTVSADIENPDGILLRSFNMHEMQLPSNLKAVARAGAGVNNIPIEKCSEQGIVVFNTPGANANAVKELVLAALLLSSRKIVDGIEWVKSLSGQTQIAKTIEKGKSNYVGPEISGKKLGVIGLGAIGVMVANAAKSLGMVVEGFDPFISVDAAWALSRGVNKSSSLENLIATSDYISVHIPLNDKTRNMFNKNLFAGVKKGARLINFSRADLVDSAALKEAIDLGIISNYVTDFPTDDIFEYKNVIAIPHLGASTPESEDNCAEMAATEIKNYLEYGIIKNSVNFPDCELPYTGKKRIVIIHKNIPNVVSPSTNVFAKHDINIEDMINKSKNNWAITVIDINDCDNAEVIKELQAIDGVICVRIIDKRD